MQIKITRRYNFIFTSWGGKSEKFVNRQYCQLGGKELFPYISARNGKMIPDFGGQFDSIF